jgi:DNA polymerase I-like protein with 3'-5' exonuclease and polymerase domains
VAFKLDCPPTKSGLKSIGKKDLRVGAKATIFARNYGGGAETIARKIQEEGVLASVEDVQRMLDAIDEIYPDTVRYKNDAMARVLEPGWLASCFGRYRRFIPTNDPSVLGELQRKAANFGMQAGVADGMNEGLDNLYNHPRKEEIGYRIVLQIHDAALLEVPVEHVDEVYDKIMPECLTEKITFRSCDLDGIAYPDSPVYRFGIDRKVCYRWGEALTWKECDALGVDTRYGYNPKSN